MIEDPLAPPPNSYDLDTNRRCCAQRYLYAIGLELDGGQVPREQGEEDVDPYASLRLLCASLERTGATGPALEFMVSALDLLEALDDARGSDPGLSALAGAGDAWQTATEAWSAWESEARRLETGP